MNHFSHRIYQLEKLINNNGDLWKTTYSDGFTVTQTAIETYLDILKIIVCDEERPISVEHIGNHFDKASDMVIKILDSNDFIMPKPNLWKIRTILEPR